MNWHSMIFDWPNAIFAASIVFWTIYLFIQMISPTGEDISMEHEVDIDHDLDFGHDVGHDHDHDSEAESGTGDSLISSFMSFLGVGKCPLGIILMVFGISWGFIGLVSNYVFSSLIIIPKIIYFWPSVATATILGLGFTRFVSVRVAKWLPKEGSSAVKIENLIGKTGTASVEIDALSGRARVRDDFGAIHNVYCRTEASEKAIPESESVILLQYLPEATMFVVRRKPNISEKEMKIFD
jgi:hypothetical protein